MEYPLKKVDYHGLGTQLAREATSTWAGNFFILRLKTCILSLRMHVFRLRMCISKLKIQNLAAWAGFPRQESCRAGMKKRPHRCHGIGRLALAASRPVDPVVRLSKVIGLGAVEKRYQGQRR